ncbi:MAG: BON domain-containing protein [Chitinophagaceae bacterium]|jgi:osmotically-inducible protein OsmY|nr:MAG: BON domain-containing protein [Chitinophagaceae bacterium]
MVNHSKDSSLPGEQEDRWIEEEIKRKFNAITTWDATGIKVKVKHGIVLLTGTVADSKALEQSVLVVFTVKGLKQIDNKIRIRKDGIASIISHLASDIEAMTDDKDEDKDK